MAFGYFQCLVDTTNVMEDHFRNLYLYTSLALTYKVELLVQWICTF